MKTLSEYELYDLEREVTERMPDGILPALSQANRIGELAVLLCLLGMGDLVDDHGAADMGATRIVVLGDSMVKESKLKSLARKCGFDPKDSEFALGYGQMKHYDFGKLRDTFLYRAVLVGPMPHSTSGKLGSSNAISEMEGHPDMYPPVFELRGSNGLKITNNSFVKALEELAKAS